MKINNKILSDFLKKIKLEGMEQINEAIFDFTNEGLKVSVMSPTNTVRVDAVLNMSAFIEYESIGVIGLQDIPTIIKVIEKFNEELTIITTENTIKFTDKNKEMTTDLVDTQFIKKLDEAKVFEFDDQVKMNIKDIQDIISDANINKDFCLRIETKENSMMISTDGKYKFKRIFNIEGIKGGVNCNFGSPLFNAVSNLTDVVTLNLKVNFPMQIIEQTEKSFITMVIAPRIDNN